MSKINTHWKWLKCKCGSDIFRHRLLIKNNCIHDSVIVCAKCKEEPD